MDFSWRTKIVVKLLWWMRWMFCLDLDFLCRYPSERQISLFTFWTSTFRSGDWPDFWNTSVWSWTVTRGFGWSCHKWRWWTFYEKIPL
jgi:hypothetical protein